MITNPNLNQERMKQLFAGLVLPLVCLTVKAQEKKSSFENISVVNTKSGVATELSWKKGSESVSYFMIERSTDGRTFRQCGLVFPSEDPSFTDYKFRDKVSPGSAGFTYRVGLVTPEKVIIYLPARQLALPAKA
jgi:hypothetical protein